MMTTSCPSTQPRRSLQIKPPACGLCRVHQHQVPRGANSGNPRGAVHGRCRHRSHAHGLWTLGQRNRQDIHAAWLAGITVERIRFLTYALSGTLGRLDGVLLAGYCRGADVDLGNEHLLASVAVEANVPGLWGAALFLVLLLTMLNTFGVSAGVRLVVTGLVIVAVIAAAGRRTAGR
jgi:hypothetical protein